LLCPLIRFCIFIFKIRKKEEEEEDDEERKSRMMIFEIITV